MIKEFEDRVHDDVVEVTFENGRVRVRSSATGKPLYGGNPIPFSRWCSLVDNGYFRPTEEAFPKGAE